MSRWLLFNAKWAIFQPYHGESKIHWDDFNDVHFVLDQHAESNFIMLANGRTDGRQTLTHDKSSHGLWPGELKKKERNNIKNQIKTLISKLCMETSKFQVKFGFTAYFVA